MHFTKVSQLWTPDSMWIFTTCLCLHSCLHLQEEQNRGKPNWEHLNDDLHVLITVEDAQNRADIKLKRAVDEVTKLLVPAVSPLTSDLCMFLWGQRKFNISRLSSSSLAQWTLKLAHYQLFLLSRDLYERRLLWPETLKVYNDDETCKEVNLSEVEQQKLVNLLMCDTELWIKGLNGRMMLLWPRSVLLFVS